MSIELQRQYLAEIKAEIENVICLQERTIILLNILKLFNMDWIIKSYTDLKQLKKLMEILPLESAEWMRGYCNKWHGRFLHRRIGC